MTEKRYCPGSDADPDYSCEDFCDHYGIHENIPGCDVSCSQIEHEFCEFPLEEPEKKEAKWVEWPNIHDGLWVCSQCGQQMGAANKDQLPEKCSNCGASMDVK